MLDPISGQPLSTNEAFVVTFSSKNAGQGMVLFGTSCNALVNTATQDRGAGTTSHTVIVTGNDLPGTVGNIGLTQGQTYYYETVTATGPGTETDNNGGRCYTATAL